MKEKIDIILKFKEFKDIGEGEVEKKVCCLRTDNEKSLHHMSSPSIFETIRHTISSLMPMHHNETT